MIIDAHVHFGESIDGRKNDIEKVFGVMDAASIDKSVIFPFTEKNGGENFELANKRISDASKQNKRLIPAFRLDPNGNCEHEISKAKADGVGILKLHPRGQNFRLDSDNIAKMMKNLEDIEFYPLIMIHTEIIPTEGAGAVFSNPADVIQLAKKFAGFNFSICHLGRWSEETANGISRMENVFADTSIAPLFLIEDALKKVGSEKLLFGSDFPYSHPLIEKKKIELLDISENDKKNIFHKNIEKLLK